MKPLIRWHWLLLPLALVGCHRSPRSPADAGSPLPVMSESFGEAPAWKASGKYANEPLTYDAYTVPITPPKLQIQIKLGMGRDQLIEALGHCGRRVYFSPRTAKARMAEIFEPFDACVSQFGDRHFRTMAGVVDEIAPGRMYREPKARNESSRRSHRN